MELLNTANAEIDEKSQQTDIDSFKEYISVLLKEMNAIQIGKFLAVSAVRNIIYFNKDLFNGVKDEDYSCCLNSLLILLGYNCVLFFSGDKNARAIARAYVRARARDLTHIQNIVRALDLEHDHALDIALDRDNDHELDRKLALDLACGRAIARALELARVIDLRPIILKDMETILNKSNDFSYDAELLMNYKEEFTAFLDKLRDLKDKYWAEWLERLYKNNFCLEQNDIKAIFSLNSNHFQQSIEVTSAYLLESIKSNEESNEIRLIILGDKGEGKTSFVRRFIRLDAAMPTEDESTEGIDYNEFTYSGISEDEGAGEISAEKDVTIRIWDFAGNDAAHAAHKFFLSNRCIYVIVCQSQGENFSSSKIEYWLEHIRNNERRDASAEEKSIFIIINKWDDNKPYINKKLIQENYREYKLVYRYINIIKDNQKNGKLDEFKHKLIKYALSTNMKVTASFIKIRDLMNLKFAQINYISMEDVKRIVANGSVEDYITVLENLNDWGYCFWSRHIPGINTVVLNPRWITGAIYKIINCVEKSPYKNASIEIRDFGKALRANEADKSAFPEEQDDFISIVMKQLGLAYIEDDKTLVIPHCLKDCYPDDETELEFDFCDSVQIEFSIQGEAGVQNPEFPRETVPLFIVMNNELIYKNIKGNSIISRDKAMFESRDGASIVEIKRLNNYRISIIAKGDNIDRNTTYLFEYAFCLSKIFDEHIRFQKQKPEVLYYATLENGKQYMIPIKDLRIKDLKQIENFYELEFKEEEFYRAGLAVANYMKNFKNY